MLGRNRAAIFEHDLVDGIVDLSPSRKELRSVGANRLADVEMHIAVTEMPERNRPASGNEGLGGGAGFFQKLRNRCDRN